MPAEPAPPRPDHDDPGLQPERTTLSWNRTLLALFLIGALQVRFLHRFGSAVLPLLIVVAVIALPFVLNRRRHHQRSVAGLRAESVPPPIPGVLFLGLGTTLLSALALVTVLTT